MVNLTAAQQTQSTSPTPCTRGSTQRKDVTSPQGLDHLTTEWTPKVPTHRSLAPVPFQPYQRSLSRGTVHCTMKPLMWTAKHVLTSVMRSMGAKCHRHTTEHGVVSIWDMKGRGQGPLTVLLHGLGGSSAEYFPTLSTLRSRCSRVVSVDLPGHGHSDPLGREISPGFTGVHEAEERMLGAVIQAVHNHLGDTPAHFIGHSLGGFVGAHVVRERRRQGIHSQFLGVEMDGADWSAERLVKDRSNFSVPTGKAARHVARCNYPQRPVLGWLYTPFLWARLASSEIQYLTHSDLKQPKLTAGVLGDLPPATMIIVGKHDKFGTEDDVNYLMRHLPETTRLLRPNTGHGDIADAHPELCAIINEFLALP